MTIHERVWEDYVDGLMERDATYAAHVVRIAREIKRGEWSNDVLAPVFQYWAGKRSTIYDAAAVGRLHGKRMTGDLSVACVHVGAEPTSDDDIMGMNARLAAIEFPFRATFWGGKAEQDGTLEWSEPIASQVFRCKCPKDCACMTGVSLATCDHKFEAVVLAPGQVPLEIGYTTSSRTISHMGSAGGIARWPYGFDHIVLMQTTPEARERESVELAARMSDLVSE